MPSSLNAIINWYTYIEKYKSRVIILVGKYRKQLNQTFTIISIVLVSILIISISISFYTNGKNQRNQYLNTLQQSTYTKSAGADIAMTVISQALTDVMQSPALESWSTATTSSTYYYYSVQAFNQLRKITAALSSVNYEIAATSLDDGSFVISNAGTSSKEYFFTHETVLDTTQIDNIFTHFKQNNVPLVIPFYNNTKLQGLYYITKKKYAHSDMIYLVKIPYATLFGKDHEQNFVLFDQDQLLAYSHLDDPTKELGVSSYKAYLNSTSREDYFKFQDKDIFLSHIAGVDWTVAYIYDDMRLYTLGTFAYIILSFILLILISFFVSKFIIKKLYKPIEEVISDISPNHSDTSPIDEFKILKQTANEIKVLSQQLEKTIAEKDLLVSQRFYRNLLFGSNADVNIYSQCAVRSSHFCVALVEFQNLSSEFPENDVFFHKNAIYSFTLENGSLQYVNISSNICAVIIETQDPHTAKTISLSIIDSVDAAVELKVAISNIRQGIDHIHSCYREALKILDYKHLFGTSEIITMDQVADLVATTYYYPLLTENRLIQSIIEGKPAAIDIFDELIRENIQHRNLAPYTLKNFLFVMIGTLSRAFQELKTTPEDLLGDPIDFEGLYNSWNNVNIIHRMKEIITGIITAVQDKNSSMDDALLSQMLTYIYENYSDDIMLNDMATEFNISSKYCSALFKKLSDDTFRNFLNKYRIDKAKEFLEKDPTIKIADLSTMVGFNSSSSFIRVFGKYTGLTPKAFADKIK